MISNSEVPKLPWIARVVRLARSAAASNSGRGSGLPYVLAALAGILVSAVASAATAPTSWYICEIYSNGDGSSQFIQLCGSEESFARNVLGRTLIASAGATTHSFVFPTVNPNPTYWDDSHRLLVGTRGFADLNLIKPDFVVPNGFLPVPSGSISISNYDVVSYAGLPADGFHAIDADVVCRPSNGDPTTAITLATASNSAWTTYGFLPPRNDDVADGRWVRAGSLHQARSFHTATLLQSGKVLVVGGEGSGSPPSKLDTAELFDPAAGTWSVTGSLNAAKSHHSATLLPTGKVLVVGQAASRSAMAELYDPATGTWTVIDPPPDDWANQTATLLNTGNVLLAAGWTGSGLFASYFHAVLYNPATNSWRNTGGLNVGRAGGHQATLLKDGRVLVTGGSSNAEDANLRDTETYDPTTGTWTRVAPLHVARGWEPTTLLADGRVLVAGGNVAEVYDPTTDKWSIAEPRTLADGGYTASRLHDGRVLVAGGYRVGSNDTVVASGAELYDPSSGRWRRTGSLTAGRAYHTATVLPNGSVLVAGGYGFGANASAILDTEVFEAAGTVATAIGAAFTGAWFNPAQNGHGFMLEVLPGTPLRLFAGWFAFAPQGGQAWITGVGAIDGNRAVVQGYQMVGSGGRFPPNFDAANLGRQDWGTLTFTFNDCNHGHVDWAPIAPGYGSGGMDLTRLTSPVGLNCQ